MKSISSFISNYSFFLLVILIIGHSFILVKLVFFPYPEFFILPYLTNAGLIPYKEIVDQHFPGLFFLPLNAAVLGLSDAGVARIWLIVITAINNLFIFLIARKISKSEFVALLASVIFTFWHPFWGGWVLWIDSFIPLILLPAFYLSYRIINSKNTDFRKLTILLGFIFSLGVILKQITLPIAGSIPLLLFFYFRDKKIFLYFFAGFAPLLLLMVFYFYRLGILTDFIYWAGIFNAETYVHMSKKAPEYPSLFQMIISYSPILFFPLIKNRKAAILLCVFIFWTLLAVTDRFDSNHFQPSLPFLAIGLALVLQQYFSVKRFLVYFLIYLVLSFNFVYKDYQKQVRDEVIIYDQKMINLSNTVKEYITSGDEIFVFGVNPLLYYLTNTIPAGRFLVFQMPWYITILEDRSIEVLESSKPQLIVRDKKFNIDGESITEFAPKISEYIDENYVVFRTTDNVELLRRK